jgi:hypothetical protein
MSQPVNKYHIDHIKLEEITIVDASIKNGEGFSSLEKDAGFDIQFKVTPGVNLQLKKIRISFDCTIQAFKDESHSQKLGVNAGFNIFFTFYVDNLTEIAVQQEDGLIDVSPELIAALSNIAYATSRGIIYTRCLGTVLGKIILPVISTPKLLGGEQLAQ